MASNDEVGMYAWRTQSTADMIDFLAENLTDGVARHKFGKEKYGPRFVGQPLNHLREELLDAMNYLIYAERRDHAAHALLRRICVWGQGVQAQSDTMPTWWDDLLIFMRETEDL